MSEETNPSEASTPEIVSDVDAELQYDPRQRYLAKLSYRLACAGPFAFLVMALLYPPTNERELPALPIQILWWTLCLCSPCGAVLGAIALVLFRKRTLGYRSLSANYAAPGLGVGVLASLALVLGIPMLTSTRRDNHYDPSRRTSCLSNVKQVGLAFMMYNQDYDDHYPLLKTWNDEIYPYTKNEAILHCPAVEQGEKPPTEAEEKLPSYAMNSHLKGKVLAALENPAQTVMIFDSVLGKNLFGDKALFPDPLRHGAGRDNTIGYVDGHAKSVAVEHFSDLLWTPTLKSKSDSAQKKDGNSSK